VSVSRLRHRVGAAIARESLWAPGAVVAVAVSGGVDSVALLDLLIETEGWHGGDLLVATVDHGLRPDSAEDARFVVDLAASRGLGVVRFTVTPSGSSEAEARAERYGALGLLPVDAIALAHHRDDLAETVLLQLLRGTGTTGLAGMRAKRGRFVLPLLEALRPGAARALARSAEVAGKDDAWLEALVVPGPPWKRTFVAEGPEPIVRRSIVRGVEGVGARAVEAVIRAARAGSGRVQVPGGALVVRGERVVWE
jgi:tRNA(Ile)-lysidine synthase